MNGLRSTERIENKSTVHNYVESKFEFQLEINYFGIIGAADKRYIRAQWGQSAV